MTLTPMTRDPYGSEQYRRTAQRQIKVGLLANKVPIRDLARQLGVDIDTVLDDLEAMEMIPLRPRRPLAYGDCGTYAAYQRHLRRAEKTCPPCRTAATRYQAERKLTRKARECAKTVAAQAEKSMSEGRMRGGRSAVNTPATDRTIEEFSQ